MDTGSMESGRGLPIIRPAEPADLPAILDVLGGEDLPTAGVAEHLGTFLVASESDRVVGVAGLEVYGDIALLRSVAVAPVFRDRRLGRRLVNETLASAARLGVRRIALLTTSAAAYFARLGFHEVDRNSLDPALQASAEFSQSCCDTAVAMARSVETGMEE